MKLSDRATGVLAIAFGAAVAASTRSFPSMPGQPIGPALFPAVVGIGFVATGVLLVVAGLRAPRGAWVELPEWTRRPRMRLNFFAVLGGVLFYALAVDRLGFFLTAPALLGALFAAFGVTPKRILPLAIGVTLIIHYSFYTLLRVPLPWGLLEAIAW